MNTAQFSDTPVQQESSSCEMLDAACVFQQDIKYLEQLTVTHRGK
jgi:hypothetical protein